MSVNPYVRRYQEAQASVLSQEQLLLMLVDCALLRAEQAEAAQDERERRIALDKLRRIVTELADTLNIEVGGAIAVGLLRAYLALLRLILKAHEDPQALAEVVRRTRNMHEMWHATVKKALEERGEAG